MRFECKHRNANFQMLSNAHACTKYARNLRKQIVLHS